MPKGRMAKPLKAKELRFGRNNAKAVTLTDDNNFPESKTQQANYHSFNASHSATCHIFIGSPFTSLPSNQSVMRPADTKENDQPHPSFAPLISWLALSLSSSFSSSLCSAGARRREGGEEENLLTADHHHFSIFKRRFGKSYASQEEHDYRFKVFKANLRRARRHQQLDPSATHGVTQFSDLTPAEFRGTYLGLRPLKLPHDAQKARSFQPMIFQRILIGEIMGSCGSCWSFSTTGALEGANFLATGNLVSLSEQQLVECDHECDPEEMGSCDSGCNGGLMNTAFEYTLKAGGLMKEEDYPYTGTDRGSCKFDKTKIAASVSNFSVISLDEDQIAANLVKNGPLAVAINAVFMQTYVGGVSCPYICSKRLDHGVLLVGYGSAGYAPIRMKDKPYWIIKNSWGENWGENGFYKICRGRNVCGVDSMVSTVAAVHTTSN
ncbi:Cysteine protease RD19A [Vitis vinifera]|uniref:Cysteine protease RD19A n=1 Tax=Vitis vinifera TaxID=29760 RepID=A0A438DME5_VITVI|nr:Cysteine protease RD19A [Vitis vinifera]